MEARLRHKMLFALLLLFLVWACDHGPDVHTLQVRSAGAWSLSGAVEVPNGVGDFDTTFSGQQKCVIVQSIAGTASARVDNNRWVDTGGFNNCAEVCVDKSNTCSP